MVWQKREKTVRIPGKRLKRKPITLFGNGRSGWWCGSANWEGSWTMLPRSEIRVLLGMFVQRLKHQPVIRAWIEEREQDESGDCRVAREGEEDCPFSG